MGRTSSAQNCCIFCGNIRRKTAKPLRFYRIPREPGLQRFHWLLMLPNAEISDRYRVCSQHFRKGRPSHNPHNEDFVPHLELNTLVALPFNNDTLLKRQRTKTVGWKKRQSMAMVEVSTNTNDAEYWTARTETCNQYSINYFDEHQMVLNDSLSRSFYLVPKQCDVKIPDVQLLLKKETTKMTTERLEHVGHVSTHISDQNQLSSRFADEKALDPLQYFLLHAVDCL